MVDIINKYCKVCGSHFIVLDKYAKRDKKTCSKKCQSILQTQHLGEYRKPKEKKVGRSKFKKICTICSKEFVADTSNSRVQCCGVECGRKLALLNNSKKIKEADFLKALSESKTMYEMCDKLKCSISAVYRCEKRFNKFLKRPEVTDAIRNDGYYNYKSAKNHRKIYEAYHKVKLLPREGVHHLDNDKMNNNIDNLFVAKSVSEHRRIHLSLEKIGFELYKKGIIGFDSEKREYYLK